MTRDLTTALLRLSATTQDAHVAAKMSGDAELVDELKRFCFIVAAALAKAARADGSVTS